MDIPGLPLGFRTVERANDIAAVLRVRIQALWNC